MNHKYTLRFALTTQVKKAHPLPSPITFTLFYIYCKYVYLKSIIATYQFVKLTIEIIITLYTISS